MNSRTLLRTIIVCLSASTLIACNRHHDQDATKSQSEAAAPEVPKVVLEAKPPPDAVSLPSAADLAPAGAAQEAAKPATTPAAPPVDPVIVDAEKQAMETDATLAGMSRREGEWSLGEAHSTYSAYSDGKNPSVIEEQLDMGDSGSSRNKYYFKDGSLHLYEEDGTWRQIDPPNPITTRHIKRTMVFDVNGKLVTAVKLIDGAPAPVEGYEANAILTHALELRNAAMAPPATPKAAAAAKTEKPATPEKPTATRPGPTRPKPEKKAAASDHDTHAATDNRLHLEAGKEPVMVKGSVAGKEVREYFVQAKAGQLMTVNLQSPGQAATFAVYSSHGEIISGLTDWSAKLPRDGDYRIRVVTTHKSGRTDYSMRVALQ
jgi:hypothetical protein